MRRTDTGVDISLDAPWEGGAPPSPAERDPPRWDSPVREARCPVCGRAYRIPLGHGRELMTNKFLRHKDRCTPARRGDYIMVRGFVTRVVHVDRSSEEHPLYVVRYPSGREGEYRASAVARCGDQGKGRERFANAQRKAAGAPWREAGRPVPPRAARSDATEGRP